MPPVSSVPVAKNSIRERPVAEMFSSLESYTISLAVNSAILLWSERDIAVITALLLAKTFFTPATDKADTLFCSCCSSIVMLCASRVYFLGCTGLSWTVSQKQSPSKRIVLSMGEKCTVSFAVIRTGGVLPDVLAGRPHSVSSDGPVAIMFPPSAK